MAKLNQGDGRPRGTGPLRTESVSSMKTWEGGPGFAREARTELFLLATTVFAGEGSFYEPAAVSDERMMTLAQTLAVTDEGYTWLCGFLGWLRADGNIRTASLMLAAEVARSHRAARGPDAAMPLTRRELVAAVQRRGDEPCEMLAYGFRLWGRALPIWYKRGIADAITRLWDERTVIRYDKPGNPVRFADAILLCHPRHRVTRYTDVVMGGAGGGSEDCSLAGRALPASHPRAEGTGRARRERRGIRHSRGAARHARTR